ncbi:rod shape-determining protein MreD [Dokdonia pacifica]|uniref:Rod shape-determining protein MreD n=1 Tax=Dokdonia pacifica TaxID=1627892 RepID=A0A239DIQ2_9FLAO|nr:rod shape-determining protein MreD [Dokdonia pacifica]GGG36706.1 rod shape-determining protein MreD [Dokdonia pacifica]SNS32267.1 rod shape-determining protein MreD [Dokdonia pacifica]
MKNSVLINSVRFLSLVLAQVLIFNNIDFMGYINPYPYMLFILVFPFNANRSLYLILAFLTGLTIDMFGNSGGIHAAACLVVAYFRPIALRLTFGVSYEYNAIKLPNVSFYERLVYISSLVFVHHLVLFSLEVFNISNIIYILKKTLFTGIFTSILCLMFNILFSSRRE